MSIPPYKGYVELLSSKFIARLEDILPDYNFDYGVEFEIAICEILRAFLPEKFGVCRGHIVDIDGKNVGDDIIIYDQQRFPTIKLHAKEQFARKENIPVEAVYAYFEAKHNLTENSLRTALKQIRTVKEFVSKRKKIDLETFDPYLTPLSREKVYTEDFPTYRNPIFCGILARKTEFSFEDLKKLEKEFEKGERDVNNPETIVFSAEYYMQIGYDYNGDQFRPTSFLAEEKDYSYSLVRTKGQLAFGMCLIGLITATDWVRLGNIGWADVINHYITSKFDYSK